MRRTLRLLATVALLAACVDEDDGVFAERDEQRRFANEATAALELEGGAVRTDLCPAAGDGGPGLLSVRSPFALAVDADHDVHLVAAAEDAAGVAGVSVTVLDAERRIHVERRIPDGDDSTAIDFTWRGVDAGGRSQVFVRYALVDADGRCGPSVTSGFGLYEGSSGGELTMYRAHDRATLTTRFVERPDATWLVTGGYDGLIQVWDVATGRPVRTLRGHTGPVLSVDVSSDGTRLVSGAQDNTGRLWDLDTGALLETFGFQLGFVRAVAVSPQDRWFALGSWDGTVEVWSLEEPERVATLETGYPVNALAFAADGAFLAVGGGRLLHEGRVQAWATQAWSAVANRSFDREVTALAFDSAEARLAVAYGRGRVEVLAIPKGDVVHAFDGAHADTIPAVGFFPANEALLGVVTLSGHTTIYALASGAVIADGKAIWGMTSAVFSPSGAWLAFGDDAGQARVDPVLALPTP